MLKAREICDTMAKGVPYVMIISYIINKGTTAVKKITDKDIDNLKETPFMTKEFTASLVRAAREICNECDQSDIVRLIKAEWCCAGEVYDKDLDQYVNAKDNDVEEDKDGNIHENRN